MIQTHKSLWGNFESCGLEDQDVCPIKLQLGVSIGRVKSGLGSTQNWPNSIGLKDGGPAADREKLWVESD